MIAPLLDDAAAAPVSVVAEVQGLYGAYSFPEKLLQKIWLRGDYDRAELRTLDRRLIRVVDPGRWNLLGGPDFKGARLRFDDGPEVSGDVEMHLHAGDWAAHGHAQDRAYDAVVLHLVLFPAAPGHVTRAGDGHAIPVAALLPLLHHDLEQFAADEALETLASRPLSQIHEQLARSSAGELAALLRRHATRRWQQKIHFARVRVQRLGWTAACHHTALEILGYRFNRSPMLRIAAAWPLATWAEGAVAIDAMLRSETAWSVQGVRPASHPRVRLRQYAAWSAARTDWPTRLTDFGATLPLFSLAEPAGRARRTHGFASLRARIGTELCAGAIGGTRLDNLVCDGFLPLLMVEGGRDFFPLWFNWYAGDLPPLLDRALRDLGVIGRRHHPAAHGPAQGLLGWLIEQRVIP